jgi:HK97 family phage major capsid protein
MKFMNRSALLASGAAIAMPRAVSALPRADASDPKVLIAQINTAVAEMRQLTEERLDGIDEKIKAKVDPLDLAKFDTINASITELERTLDTINAKIASDALNGGRPVAADPEYSEKFSRYFQTGEGENDVKAAQRTGPRAAMSEGSSADGGYTTPIEWDRSITGRLKLISPIRQNATVQSISKLGFTKLFTDRAVGSGWVGETAARPATSTPQFTALAFSLGEIYANAAASQDLLDDSETNIEQWLVGEIDTEFDRQEGIAFLSGDGTNKPFGLLSHVTGGASAARHPWGAILTTASGGVGVIAPDALVTLQYALPAAYTPNAKFFMNRNSLGTIRKLKDGQGNYLWQPSFQAGVPATLGGYPVVDVPDMPAATTGNIGLLFGDMAATYLVIDRMGTRVLRDPYTNKPYVCFYVTKRVGGGVVNPDAMKAMVIG